MRLFQLNSKSEKYFIAAHTIVEAIQLFCSLQSTTILEMDHEDDIIEVPREKWDEMTIKDPEGEEESITFLQYMENLDIPEMIATTEEM